LLQCHNRRLEILVVHQDRCVWLQLDPVSGTDERVETRREDVDTYFTEFPDRLATHPARARGRSNVGRDGNRPNVASSHTLRRTISTGRRD
jgi:hypothetical protein